jgi:hypothetical protein
MAPMSKEIQIMPSPMTLKPITKMRVDADAMQKRLSARSSSVVESPRSGGGYDPKLTHVRTIQANDF